MNKNALNFFKELTKNSLLHSKEKLLGCNDFTELDYLFIKNYITNDTKLLDIGSGSGLIINRLINDIYIYIEAIEPIKEFSQFILKNNIVVCNQTISEYIITKQFDLLTCFGFCNYLDEKEILEFYKKFYFAVKDGGKIIIKNQFGVQEDVIINKYSEELKAVYYSEYRTVEKEKKLMAEAGFKNFEVFDIYPPECNRWDNTHFYAIVAEK